MSDGMDAETIGFAKANLLDTVGLPTVAIVRDGAEWVVHQHTAESVFPQVRYDTARKAVARVMQLMGVGPVAPQTHPETAAIGTVTSSIRSSHE